MNVNFSTNTLSIGILSYNLDDVRGYLLNKLPVICSNYRIASHVSKGERIFTYDWQGLFDTLGIDEHITVDLLQSYGIKPLK